MGYEVFDRLCKEKGVTAYQVAKETGVSTATLSSWKVGRYTPKAEKIKKLADYFGVSPEYFHAGKEPKTINISLSAVMGAIDQALTATGADEKLREAFQSAASEQGYYTDPETAASAQTTFDDPDIRMLLDAARGAKSKDIKMAADLLRRLKETNPDG